MRYAFFFQVIPVCLELIARQHNPVYEFHSERSDVTLELTDSYIVRNEILEKLHRNANNWLDLALARAPMELKATLQVSTMFLLHELMPTNIL